MTELFQKSIWIVIFSWLALFCMCTIEAPVTETETEIEAKTEVNKVLLLQLVNSYRASGCDCGSEGYYAPTTPVTWNDTLALVAKDHSEDMFKNKFFSHTGSDNSNPGTRLERYNYDWRTYGENIAYGHQTEKSVIEDWIKSPGHCSNIMAPNFKEMGVAKAGDCWTQLFGTRK